MSSVKYSRYTGEDFGISAEELMKALSDFLLESGFNQNYMQFSEMNRHTLEELKQAIQRALESGELFNNDQLERMMQQLQNMSAEQMEQLVDRLAQKLVSEGYLDFDQQPDPQQAGQAGVGDQQREVKVEITDKSLDFLGFKTLKDLLASLGKSSFGAHDTRDLATGVEASGASKLTSSATR